MNFCKILIICKIWRGRKRVKAKEFKKKEGK